MKDVDNAWNLHNEDPDGFHCIDEKDFNKVLGHSRFNEACKRRVMLFAKENPLVRPEKVLPDIKPPKIRCVRCGKKFDREDMYLFEEDVPGPLKQKITYMLCKRKCAEKKMKKLGITPVQQPQSQQPADEVAVQEPERPSPSESVPAVAESPSPQKTVDTSSQGQSGEPLPQKQDSPSSP